LNGFKNLVAFSCASGYEFAEAQAFLSAAASAPGGGAAAAGGSAAAATAAPAEEKVEEEAKADDGEKKQEEDAGSEESGDDIAALMTFPEKDAPMLEKVQFYLGLPVYAALYYGIPPPSDKWFMATFCVSLMWIAGFSFILVHCVELFGNAILGGGNGVTIVMSFTLLASGTSIPDLVSSMAVAKAGASETQRGRCQG